MMFKYVLFDDFESMLVQMLELLNANIHFIKIGG